MAASVRIIYEEGSQIGALIKSGISHTLLAKQDLTRAKALLDAITGGGTTPANLNSDPAVGVTVVDGATASTPARRGCWLIWRQSHRRNWPSWIAGNDGELTCCPPSPSTPTTCPMTWAAAWLCIFEA